MRVFTRLLTPDDARARYRAQWRPRPTPAETVPLASALGRVLAEDVTAAEDLPPFDRSTVDGYALRTHAVAAAALLPAGDAGSGAGVRLRLVGAVRMGEAATVPVGAGEAVQVPTGGMLPPGADAVVMQEQVVREGDVLVLPRLPAPGENVLRRGADVRAGEVVLPAGRRLRPADLGLLAGLGITRVTVRRPPRVAIFSSGDEVVPPEAVPGPGQVRDMNAPTLAALVREAGGEPAVEGILPDDRPVVEARLRQAVATCDLVLVSGGSSVGERDVVVDAIAALGPPGIVVHGIAIKPGKPTVLALAGATPVVGLPGNPVSAMVIFARFVRPLLAALLGMAEEPARYTTARLARPLRAPAEREEHVRVRLEVRAGERWAVPLPAASGVLTSMVRADGFVVLPPGREAAEGSVVEVELLG